VFGIRGMGKTTLARQLVAGEARMLAYDPFGEHDALALDWSTCLDYLDAHRLERFRVAVTEGGHEHEFCALAWELAEHCGGLTVVLEEADLVARPMVEPEFFRQVVARGRHREISIVSTSQRPAQVSRLLTSQAAEVYCFRTHEPADVRHLRSILGDVADQLPELEPFEYVHWTPTACTRSRLPTPR
jgi:DNA helicase HerA-like ATPase